MNKTKTLVSLAAIFALAVLSIASASAFGYFVSPMEVSGVDVFGSRDLALFAGETVPVKVTFYAYSDASDVRVKAWVSGEQEYAVSTERFDVIAGRTYTKTFSVKMPERIDPSEKVNLELVLENKANGISDAYEIDLTVQRNSYSVNVLDVILSSEAKAGQNMALDIILKNVGMHMAEDTFVKAKITALGIESKAYFGDLSAVDQSNPDRDDSAERRMYLSIPASAPAGTYLLEIEAYNADASTKITKQVVIVSPAVDSTPVIASPSSKRFGTGAEAQYSITIVNSGNNVRVYEIAAETPSALTANLADSVVVIPAGSSKTINFNVASSTEGRYNFAVNVYADGALVKRVNFLADVSGKASATSIAGNTTVLLTVILAIIFVVLLVVLIVLLTRKPEKAEELGESYY